MWQMDHVGAAPAGQGGHHPAASLRAADAVSSNSTRPALLRGGGFNSLSLWRYGPSGRGHHDPDSGAGPVLRSTCRLPLPLAIRQALHSKLAGRLVAVSSPLPLSRSLKPLALSCQLAALQAALEVSERSPWAGRSQGQWLTPELLSASL